MNSENYDMVEKILLQIQQIIQEDDELQEFSLIPTSSGNYDKNVSPVKHAPNICLGLETWCIKLLFKYAQDKILNARSKYKKPSKEMAKTIDKYLLGAILIQPEVSTFWNIKRELYEAGFLNLDRELKISQLVLSNKHKSLEAYSYRRWLLNKLPLIVINPSSTLNFYVKIIENELSILYNCTFNTSNNYHAWNHRIWCFLHIILPHLPLQMAVNELEFTKQWIYMHVSENTCFHYRQFILNCFLDKISLPSDLLNLLIVSNSDENSNFLTVALDGEYINKIDDSDIFYYNQYICLLLNELNQILPILHFNFPGHEAIWSHRRYTIYHIYKTLSKIYGFDLIKSNPRELSNLSGDINIIEIDVPINSNVKKCNKLLALEMSDFFIKFLNSERDFLHQVQEKNGNDFIDMGFLVKYKKWLHFVLHVYT